MNEQERRRTIDTALVQMEKAVTPGALNNRRYFTIDSEAERIFMLWRRSAQ